MMRSLVGAVALLAALGVSGAAACTDDGQGRPESLPDGGELLRQSAQAMREVETLKFNLSVEGTIPGVAIRGAEGQLTRDGDVKGTGQLNQGDATSEIEFVIVDDSLYLKGPTGGFQRLPASVAATVYDPSKILDPDLGVAALVAGGTQPRTEAREQVDGTDAYRIAVTLPRDKLTVLLPGVSTDLNGQLWVAANDPKRLLRAKVDVPATGGGEPGTVTLGLSEFNEPVTITPPS
jgi:lipoprotein LprG